MNPFLLYIIKAALSLAGLYIVYLLFLGRDTLYERNRFFILFSVFASLIFPLIVIETRQPFDIQFFGKDLTGFTVENNPDMLVNPAETRSPERIYSLLLNIYFTGLIFFIIRIFAELFSLICLILRQKNREDNIIRLRNHRNAGFSAFGYIFIDGRLSPDIARHIINHEQKHLKNLHFLDILLIEFIKAVQWFNPFVYLIDKSLREVHEFQADEECLNSGITIRRYQGLLLNQVFRTNIFSVSDGFSNPTIIKKRIIMMTRKRSGVLANLKMLLTLPVIIFLLLSFSTASSVEMLADYASPPFLHETYQSLLPPPVTDDTHIKSNTVTVTAPVSSELQKERYVITEDMDAEALRIVSSMAELKTGYPGGTEESVSYMVPVTFTQIINEASHPSPAPPPPPVTGITNLPGESVITGQDPGQTSMEFTPSLLAEQMPVYPGGDAALLKYISRNSIYPGEAKISGKEGRVIVRFCVTETGDVDLVSVIKSVDPDLDAEAVRVVSTLSGFRPAMQGGKPVPVWYSVPITFTLI